MEGERGRRRERWKESEVEEEREMVGEREVEGERGRRRQRW